MISNKNIPGEIKDFGILVFSGDVLLFYFRFVLPRGITGGEARKIHILQNFFKGKDRLVFRQRSSKKLKIIFCCPMMEKGILFLVRLKSSDYKKEQSALSALDTWVDIHLDKSRTRHYKGTDIGQRVEELGYITLRMVKVPLPEEREEVLITNLLSETFGCLQIAGLYHMRWWIETAYGTLKDRLQMENFTGTEPILLLQDIYSTIYISNLAEDIIRDAETELAEKEKHRKHKMMVNRTLSIGILKNDLIYILLETDVQKQDKLFQQMYEDISKVIVNLT